MFLTYFYLARVPIFCSLTVGLLALVGIGDRIGLEELPGHSMVEGMFDLQPWPAIIVTGLIVLFGTIACICTDLIIKEGHARANAPPLPDWTKEEGF